MSYAVIHLTKFKSAGGIGTHIDRKVVPENADPSRVHLNRELIKSPNDLHKDIARRIAQGYTSSRKIRKDAVKSVGVILSGSHQRMKELEAAGQLEQWYKANWEFAKERFGRENIVRFTLHMDEKTPHIHCVFVPIKDGKLRYKAFIPSKRDLVQLQDDYALKMAKFGLKRGLTRQPVKHISTRDYYGKLNQTAAEAPAIAIQTDFLGRVKEPKKQSAELNLLFKTILGDLSAQKIKNDQMLHRAKKIQTEALKWRQKSNILQTTLLSFAKEPKKFEKWRANFIAKKREKAQRIKKGKRL